MSLLEDTKAVCRRLAPTGWGELLAGHGLDLEAQDLEAELLKDLEVDRSLPGFEDFAAEGRRAIEPGQPARSLLYHALASPGVVVPDADTAELMPTRAEIGVVENLVYGLRAPRLAQLRARFPGAPLALAVFAFEYRPAADTVHRRHADLCFARTGVARVGTRPHHYDRVARGFTPFAEEPTGLRVLPAQYAPFIAVQLRGDSADFGPLNAWVRPQLFGEDEQAGDQQRLFWVPLHKLFPGDECLRGRSLTVRLRTRHRNEKLRRIRLRLGAEAGGEQPADDLEAPPFAFTAGIAEWAEDPELGDGVLAPVVHDELVEPARKDGRLLTFRVPPDSELLASSLNLPAEDGRRSAPEFVHVRRQVSEDGSVADLNELTDVVRHIKRGDYSALHYVDFTGDGVIDVQCPELAAELVRSVPAYSIVAAPDFFPNCSQRELLEWWLLELPSALRDRVWVAARFPLTLSDERLAPNLQFPGADFRARDDTITAIVAPPGEPGEELPSSAPQRRRQGHLPDSAAGVFAPGWDISVDGLGDTEHLSAYGLGSPFPEDAKLCAALSAFWPSASPDSGRSFSQFFRTVTPQTDEEIGSVGALPWDGVAGPQPAGERAYRVASFAHVDYVTSALESRFSLALTGAVHTREYIARTLALIRLYDALEISPDDDEWRLLSFRATAGDDGELAAAQDDTGEPLVGAAYRCVLGQPSGAPAPEPDHRLRLVRIEHELTAFVAASAAVLVREGAGAWRVDRGG